MPISYNGAPTSALLFDVLLKNSLRRRQRLSRIDPALANPPRKSFVKKHGLHSSILNNSTNSTTTPNLLLDDQNPAQGKRQRRQAAATLVQNFPSWTGVGKKSKAQPRPAVQVPPRGIGPVTEPNQNDVLCGRGGRCVVGCCCLVVCTVRFCFLCGSTDGLTFFSNPTLSPPTQYSLYRINSHEGNVQFRDIVADTKKDYLAKSTKKLEKAHIAAGVVQQIRQMEPSGRFLKEDGDTGMWWDIGDAKAIKKVGQALREDAPEIRDEIIPDDNNNSNGDANEGDAKKDGSSKSAEKKVAVKSPRSADKSVSSGNRNVIVLPTTRSNRRGEDCSPGALPPQRQLLQQQQQLLQQQQQQQQMNGMDQYQQVLPVVGSGASITQVSLPSMGPPSQTGAMYPPSSNNSNSAATLRHGQFSLRGQGAMSQKAMEMMNMNQQQQMQNNMLLQGANGAFGRSFIPPSEMSLGSHGSSVSGLSGFTNSQLMDGTLLSGLSDGVSSLTAGDASYRMQLAASLASGQRFSGLNQQQLATLQAMNNQQQQAAANAVAAANMNNAANNNNNATNNNSMNANNMNVGMFQQRNANMGSNGSVFSGSRGSNGFNNYSLTSGSRSGGSDLSGQTMPQAAAIFGRTSSHNDLSSLMGTESTTEHSLLGGGIRNSDGSFRHLNNAYQQQQLQHQLMQQQQLQQAQQQHHQQQAQRQHQQQQQQQQQQQNDQSHLDGMDSSYMSGNSFVSPRARGSATYKDGMDFSVFSGASLANSVTNRSSARPPTRPAAAAYQPASTRYNSNQSVAGRSHASNYSIGAMSQSIASMSLQSGGASVASFSG